MGDRLFEHVLLYCERGVQVGLWAEPANLVSNAAFLVVAVAIWRRVARDADALTASSRQTLTAMAGLTGLVGLGSGLFHAVPTRAAQALDVAPIGALVTALFWLVLRWVFHVPAGRGASGLAVFMFSVGLATWIMRHLECQPGWRPYEPVLGSCLNGSWPYLPVLAALAICAGLARRWAAETATCLTAAAAVFAVALAARSLDLVVCPASLRLSLHAVWHVGAAITTYAVLRALLVAAARDHAGRTARPNVRTGF